MPFPIFLFLQTVIENNKFFEQYEVTYQILKKAAEMYAKANGSRKQQQCLFSITFNPCWFPLLLRDLADLLLSNGTALQSKCMSTESMSDQRKIFQSNVLINTIDSLCSTEAYETFSIVALKHMGAQKTEGPLCLIMRGVRQQCCF